METRQCKVSTYEKHYKRPPREYFPTKATGVKQTDPNLIPGHWANNIILNNSPYDTHTWEKPNIKPKPEEYKNYVQKLKEANPYIYQKYFTKPFYNPDIAEDNARDLKRSTYQHCYSPNQFLSLKQSLRWANSKLDTSSLVRYESTYKTYFRDVNYCRVGAFSNEWLEHPKLSLKLYGDKYRTPTSTYYEKHCFLVSKIRDTLIKDGKLREGPIDRYTQRRY